MTAVLERQRGELGRGGRRGRAHDGRRCGQRAGRTSSSSLWWPVSWGRRPPASSACCLAISMIVSQVGKLGCDTALVHFIPRWRAASDGGGEALGHRCGPGRRRRPRVPRSAAVWVAAPASLVSCWRMRTPVVGTQAMQMTALSLPPAAVTAVALAATRGYGVVRPLVLNDQVVKPLLRLRSVGLVVAAGGGAVAAVFAWALVQWMLLPWALHAVWRLGVASGTVAGRPTAGAGLPALQRAEGLSASVEVVGMQAGLPGRCRLLGTTEAGRYAVAMRLVLAGYLTLQAVRLAVAPRRSPRLSGSGGRARPRSSTKLERVDRAHRLAGLPGPGRARADGPARHR